MRAVYYDFYATDFILYMPDYVEIVEIGVRMPRTLVKSTPLKCTPYILCVFPSGVLQGSLPHRFRVIPMSPSDRIQAEADIEGGAPTIGRQLVTRTIRPLENNVPYSNVAHMQLIGKLTLPSSSVLSAVKTKSKKARYVKEVLDENATHLLYRESFNTGATTTNSVASSMLVSDINENNIARAF